MSSKLDYAYNYLLLQGYERTILDTLSEEEIFDLYFEVVEDE